ncbi:hypothetical protein [Methyloprofundus sp.]|uniref:hypothetical protein n=1 Tax=Methyloprofundus sp. TaxID=2020875 RepID=UPI003D12DE8C
MLDSALQKRYVILLKYQEQLSTTQYLFKLSELLAQEISLIQRQVMTDKFNAEKLLDAEGMLVQSSGLAVLNLARLNEIQTLLGLPLDSAETVLDSSGGNWLISFEAITGRLADMTEVSQTAPKITDQRLKVEMTQAKNELIKTEQQIGVNLLRFTYKDNKNDETAFQFGINIPLGTQFNRAESQYQLQKAQAQLDHSIVKVQQSLDEIKKEISWLAGEKKLANLQIQRVQKHLKNEALKATPSLLINLRKQLVEQHKKSTEIKQKALRQYISYLSLSGQLTEQPLRNWIHTGEPELVPGKVN